MNLPDYITTKEVQRVCLELGFRDWTQMGDTALLQEEAEVLQALVGAEALQIPIDEFQRGVEASAGRGSPSGATVFCRGRQPNGTKFWHGHLLASRASEMGGPPFRGLCCGGGDRTGAGSAGRDGRR